MCPDGTEPIALDLVVELCRALEDERIRYCHWKSNEAIARSASGDNDLDLLVDRTDADRFGAVLHRLGFKEARPTPSREVPGLIDHYGLDARSGRLVHLQAHYQLVLGDDMTKNVHLPVEREYLDSVGSEGLIPVPAPEFELAVFVVRMVLKHSTWDAQLCLLGGLSASEQRELDAPSRAGARARPCVGARRRAAPRSPLQSWSGASDPSSRHRRGGSGPRSPAFSRRSSRPTRATPGTSIWPGAPFVVASGVRATSPGAPARKRLVNGGTLIAVTGPQSVLARAVGDDLAEWLAEAFAVERYPGAGSGPTFRRARRFASNGGIAICDQLPTDGSRPDLVVELDATDSGRHADDVRARGPQPGVGEPLARPGYGPVQLVVPESVNVCPAMGTNCQS